MIKTLKKGYVGLSVLILVLGLPFTSNAAAIYKGIIGVHTRYSDGKDSVEDYCRTARELGYSFIVFTETYEKMDKLKWEKLKADCKNERKPDFYPIPALDVPAGYNRNVRAWVIDPKRYPDTLNVVNLLFDVDVGQYYVSPMMTSQRLNGFGPQNFVFYQSMEVFAYKGNKLIDDASPMFEEMMANKYRFQGFSGHRIYSIEELKKAGGYITYFRGGVFQNTFLSEGPLIEDFSWTGGGWYAEPKDEPMNINISISSKNPLKEITLYKNNEIFRHFFPISKTFEITIPYYPVQAASFWLKVIDASGARAFSNYLYVTSRPFYNEMCMDNQNNILALLIENSHILLGAAHTGGNLTHLGFLWTDKELLERKKRGELEETGVTSAIWGFSAAPYFYAGKDWTRFDKISFYLKTDTPGIGNGPYWSNAGQAIHLSVQPKDNQWQHYELDISKLPRDRIQGFAWALPTAGEEPYTVWIDEIELVNTTTKETALIDDFEKGVKDWQVSGGVDVPSSSPEAKQGKYCLKAEVEEGKAGSSNAIAWKGVRPDRDFGPYKLHNTLSTSDCIQWAYLAANKMGKTKSTFTIFRPRLYSYNIVLVEIETNLTEDINLVPTDKFEIPLIGAGTAPQLGKWPRYFYVGSQGKRVEGETSISSPVEIAKNGFVALYPNWYGSFAFYAFDAGYSFVANTGNGAGISLGYKKTGIIPAGTVMKNRFLLVLDSGEEKIKEPEGFLNIYDVYGFDGKPAYQTTLTHGSVIDNRYVLVLGSKDYYVTGRITRAGLPNDLGIIVEEINPNWDAGFYDNKSKNLKRIGVVENTAYLTLDINPQGDKDEEISFFVGNLLVCDNPSVKLNLLKPGEDGNARISAHNPTEKSVSILIKSPLDIVKGTAKISLGPGETKTVSLQ